MNRGITQNVEIGTLLRLSGLARAQVEVGRK